MLRKATKQTDIAAFQQFGPSGTETRCLVKRYSGAVYAPANGERLMSILAFALGLSAVIANLAATRSANAERRYYEAALSRLNNTDER